MENIKFPESWEQAIKNTLQEHGYKPQLVGITYAAKHMAERYEARIAELESIISENRYRFEVIDTNMTLYLSRIKELESGLKTVIELSQDPSDSNCLLAGQIASNLVSK